MRSNGSIGAHISIRKIVDIIADVFHTEVHTLKIKAVSYTHLDVYKRQTLDTVVVTLKTFNNGR